MKKKLYLISYAIVQMLVSVYMMIFSDKIVSEQLKSFSELFETFPKEIQSMMMDVFSKESLTSSVWMTAIAGVILGGILLWIFAKNKISSKKGLAIALTVTSLLLFGGGIVLVMSAIALVVIASFAKENSSVVKEKKNLEKLQTLKETRKDRLWVVVLVLAYCTQFVIPDFINNTTLLVIFDIVYNVLLFVLVFYIFRNRFKRDFKAFKDNKASYIGYIFKWWGIMLGLSLVAGIFRIILGGAVETLNQEALNSMPLWYVGPLAVIWAPVVEEGIFRGGLRRFITNDKLFIILSAIIFGLLHTIGSETGIDIVIQSLQYMVMGGVMAYTYTKTNNILVNMGIHCIQNTLGVLMMLFMSFV